MPSTPGIISSAYVVPGGGPTPVFQDDFNRSNGAIGSPWFDAGSPTVKILSNKASTDNFTGLAYAAFDLTSVLSDPYGDWTITFDIVAPLIIGDGGVTLGIVDGGFANGFITFIGNAAHIYKVQSTVWTYVTNFGRTGEHSPGVLANSVKYNRRKSDGRQEIWLDGADWGATTITDVTIGSPQYFLIGVQNATSPTNETSIDNLKVYNTFF